MLLRLRAGTRTRSSTAPGLSAVGYRLGHLGRFRADMLDALSTVPELAALRTRDPDDFTIALLDAWAVVCDILTFYQERIANEAYLRTATERVSIGELAKLIGYKLRPGLAASVALAFTIDAAAACRRRARTRRPTGMPSSVTLPSGTRGADHPGPGCAAGNLRDARRPVTARAGWNAIRLAYHAPGGGDRVQRRHRHAAGRRGHRCQGGRPAAGRGARGVRFQVAATGPPGHHRHRVEHHQPPLLPRAAAAGPRRRPGTVTHATARGRARRRLRLDVRARQALADQGELVAFATAQNWPVDQLEAHIDALRGTLPPGTGPARRVYALGVRAALFGHNAIDYTTIPTTPTPPYSNWESATLKTGIAPGLPSLDLDAVYPVADGDQVVLVDSTLAGLHLTTVSGVTELTRTGFFMSAKVSRVTLDASPPAPKSFGLRTTQVLIETDELPVQDVADTSAVAGGSLVLDGAYLSLQVGQRLAVTGVRADQQGRTDSEVVAVKALQLVDGYTVVGVDPALTGAYVRASVTVNANVADASHGESTSEILGNGNAATPFQRFALRQPPLTYTSAATASGTASTLTVRVDGVEWTELGWLAYAGAADRVYTVVQAADGRTYVQFGDGVNGARPGSGTGNIVAEYRHGTGLAGRARAGQISTLLTRPLGLKAVTNPAPANGAMDPETVTDARTNAPVTVKTLDRIVSLQDVADFAAASAGIAKAAASWVWDGTRSVACVTVAGEGGAPVTPGSDQFQNLLTAMRDASDGTLAVTLCPYVPATFTVAATVTPDPALVATGVLTAVKAALSAAFSFDARQFASPVFASEVVAVVQGVPGVVSMTLDGFAGTGKPPGPPADYVPAAAPTLGGAGLVGAELLTVEPGTLPGVVLA